MSESLPANAIWQYDYIDHYRLDEYIISRFLRQKWGNYHYYVKVGGFRESPIDDELTKRSIRATSIDSGCRGS